MTEDKKSTFKNRVFAFIAFILIGGMLIGVMSIIFWMYDGEVGNNYSSDKNETTYIINKVNQTNESNNKTRNIVFVEERNISIKGDYNCYYLIRKNNNCNSSYGALNNATIEECEELKVRGILKAMRCDGDIEWVMRK